MGKDWVSLRRGDSVHAKDSQTARDRPVTRRAGKFGSDDIEDSVRLGCHTNVILSTREASIPTLSKVCVAQLEESSR